MGEPILVTLKQGTGKKNVKNKHVSFNKYFQENKYKLKNN